MDKKDALTTLVEIERQNLQQSLEALRGAAHREIEALKWRIDLKRVIADHRYQLLIGLFAAGVLFGVRR